MCVYIYICLHEFFTNSQLWVVLAVNWGDRGDEDDVKPTMVFVLKVRRIGLSAVTIELEYEVVDLVPFLSRLEFHFEVVVHNV